MAIMWLSGCYSGSWFFDIVNRQLALLVPLNNEGLSMRATYLPSKGETAFCYLVVCLWAFWFAYVVTL